MLREAIMPAQRLGYAFAVFSALVATLLALVGEQLLNSGSLVLLYVAAVVVTGLKFGTRPALSCALLSFFSFNFFHTQPHYTFEVHDPDDVATLIFLACIGFLSGPAASRVRQHMMLLRQSNQFTETLRKFAEQLIPMSQSQQVYQHLHETCQGVLQVSCYVVDPEGNTLSSSGQALSVFTSLEQEAMHWLHSQQEAVGRFQPHFADCTHTFFPVASEGQMLAVLVVSYPADAAQVDWQQRELIMALCLQTSVALHRIELSQNLQASRLKAEVEQLRTALLSSVSHDLKSPLAAMIGAAETLKHRLHQLTEADKAELIDALCSESNRLENYIQNLLDMTRLGYGTLKIERDWVQVSDIIGSAVQRLKRYQPDARVQVQLQQPDLLIYVHAALIEQALFNVLENAIRFNPQDAPVTIVQSVLAQTLLLQVLDQGPGVPEQDREHIFDMFFVVASGDSKKNNTGMGLAICKGMIGAHGGTVSVRANPSGKGACFELSLPLNELNQPELH